MESNMKYRAPLAAAMLLAAMLPCGAQSVTGVVSLTGFVAPRCGASPTADSSFSGTINLGELTQADGTLSSVFTSSGENSPMGVADFLVGCTGGGSVVTLSATRLSNPLTPQLPTSSNDIDFTVQAKIALAAGGFGTVNYTTAAALPAATVENFPGAFAAVAGNFQVRVYGFAAENGPSNFLVAGDYSSTISILVAPAN
jgi:hypothetical protein